MANLTRLCYQEGFFGLVASFTVYYKDFRNQINPMFYQPSDAPFLLSQRPSAILLVDSPQAPSKLPALTYVSTTCSRSMTQRPPFRNIRRNLNYLILTLQMANSTAVYLPTPHILRTFGDSVPELARLVIYKNIDYARVHTLWRFLPLFLVCYSHDTLRRGEQTHTAHHGMAL